MLWRVGMDIGAETLKTVMIREDGTMEERPILRVQAQPLQRTREALQEVCEQLHREGDPDPQVYLGLTGSGGAAAARWIGADAVEEPVALTAALNRCYPDVRTLIEMGREGQKYLLFARDERTGRLIMTDCNLGDKCAAGSGAFLDHMAVRLNFDDIAEFARVALQTERPASLSGRCSVFTESDIVHLYQKGTSRERIAAGIHQAICRNYRARFARGKPFPARVAFIGGVSENPAAVKYLSQELNLNGSLFVPPYNRTLGAIGAALRAQTPVRLADALAKLEAQLQLPFHYEGTGPLRAAPSESLAPPPQDDLPKRIALAALGVDIGSVSTKAALVTEHAGRLYVLASHYRKTNGDPLAAVRDTLEHIYREIREKGFLLDQVIAATTGSGRYLTADYIGADLIKNEITAQASGTLAFLPDVETILEIGGQDSKYIRLDAGVVTDFEMNRACAAGCGAFLEKQAARLGIPVADFGDCALRATNPPPMDWTCTVFTESAMVFFQQAGVAIEDLCAAVCLASARNYLHKNVGGREIGQRVVFQGAVAFNRGMVAAFETLLGRRIVVPPYPHLTGAIGAARLALRNPAERPRFRGFERIAEGGYTVGSFECRGCANACDVNTFQMTDGPKYFYNDRCEKFSALCRDAAKPKTGRDLPDLLRSANGCCLRSMRRRLRPAQSGSACRAA
jgi:predicted CoA-substrate-specific enzyme activase